MWCHLCALLPPAPSLCVCVYMDSAVCQGFLLDVAMGHFDESDSQFTSTRALGAQVPDVTLRDAHCLV